MGKIDKIAYGVILILIVLLNVFIGSNIKEPIWIIQLIVSVFTVVYIIVKKIKNRKEKKRENIIIKGKIDVAVLILMLSTFIPLIFKTYASLEGTVNFILKYWSYFSFYILVRNTILDKKQIKVLINTLIVSSIIPVVFGYDKLLGFNIFEKILDSINAVKIPEKVLEIYKNSAEELFPNNYPKQKQYLDICVRDYYEILGVIKSELNKK